MALRQTGHLKHKIIKLIKYCNFYRAELPDYEALSVVPEFKKKQIRPFAFTARHADPKGLFQVL